MLVVMLVMVVALAVVVVAAADHRQLVKPLLVQTQMVGMVELEQHHQSLGPHFILLAEVVHLHGLEMVALVELVEAVVAGVALMAQLALVEALH